MPSLTQADRRLQIQTPLGDDALLIEKLTGAEAISEPFCFHLDLVAEAPVAFDQLLGQPVGVSLDVSGCPRRYFHGIIAELREEPATLSPTGGSLVRYTADLVPHLWLLGHRVQSRTFSEQTVPQILQKVLKDEWQLDVSFVLLEPYQPRPLCVQFQESDLAFVSRLMEGEGIRYYFDHSADQDALVVSDQALSHPKLAGAALKLVTHVGGNGQPAEPAVSTWSKSHQVRAMKVTLTDRHLQLADKDLKAPQQLPRTVLAGKMQHPLRLGSLDRLETRVPYGGYAQKFDTVGKDGNWQPQQLQKVFAESSRVARIRMEEEACGALTMNGSATATQLVPGSTFSLAAAQQADGDYLLTRVEHVAAQPLPTGPATPSFTYQNRFRCQPKDLAYRPARLTQDQPILCPVQATVISDLLGNQVHCDALGRVKVRFHWAGQDEDCSAWVPVSQAWAGNGFGSFFIPRVGNEVVVAFINGQKDQPVVVGSLHSSDNQPPFWNAGTSPPGVFPFVNGVRTHSINGQNTDYHQIYFDDTNGAELLALRSNRDFQVEVRHDATSLIQNDSSSTVQNDSTVTVHHDATAHVGHDQSIYVGWHSKSIVGVQALASGDIGGVILSPPKSAAYTYGINATVYGGMNTEIGFGSRGLCFLDPADYAVNKLWGGRGGSWLDPLKKVLTALGGKTDIIYGNDTHINYGSLRRDFTRGQVFNSVLKFKGGEAGLSTFTVIHCTTALATIVLPFAQQLTSGKTAAALGLCADIASIANTAAMVLLKVLEKKYRYAAALKTLADAQTFMNTRVTSMPAYTDIAQGALMGQVLAHTNYGAAFTNGGDGIHHEEIQDTFAIHAGKIQVIANGDVRTTAMAADAAVTTVAAKIVNVADDFQVAAAGIELQSRKIVLQAGLAGTGKIEVLPDKIVLSCGGSTVEINAAKINQLSQLISQQGVGVQAHH